MLNVINKKKFICELQNLVHTGLSAQANAI